MKRRSIGTFGVSCSGETGANSGVARTSSSASVDRPARLAVASAASAGQVDGRDEQEHGVGLVDRGHGGRHQAAEREAHQADGLLVLRAEVGEELADVPDRLGEPVDGVEDVGAGHRRRRRRARVPPAVERQREEGEVEAEVAVEVQGPEGAEVEPGPTHAEAVQADQPRPVLRAVLEQRRPSDPVRPGSRGTARLPGSSARGS